MDQSRTKKSIINISAALIGQMLSLIIAFITRIIFTRELGDIYLGINGLCTSIVGLLSLAELGVGESINYKLYRPLAEKDIEKIKALMDLYKKVYTLIGIAVIVIGLILIPILPLFLKENDTSSLPQLRFIFLLFVINSASSYFYSYKRALIISDQKRYVVTIIHYLFYCFMSIGQIIVLVFTKNFILYLLIMLSCTVIQNIIISRKADKLYPFINDDYHKKLSKNDIDEIKKNTLALMYHKIGSSVVNSTDNILLSKIIGISVVGIYSNYQLITTALNTIVGQLFSAITASVGNLGISVNGEQSEIVLRRMFFGDFWFVSVVCTAFYSVIEILIQEWFGSDMLLDSKVLICIIINLYLYNIRRTVWTFRDAYGLFWYDRYKALLEAIINLIFSIILGFKSGLIGILLGTIISTITTSLWIEPYILYKYVFGKSVLNYFITLLKYSFITVCLCTLNKWIVIKIGFSGIEGFFLGGTLCVLLSSSIIVLLFSHIDELNYYFSLSREILKNYKANNTKY